MEYNCANCKYASKFDVSNVNFVCERVQPLLLSDDSKVLEYLVDAKNTTRLVVFCEFCCIKWQPKEV